MVTCTLPTVHHGHSVELCCQIVEGWLVAFGSSAICMQVLAIVVRNSEVDIVTTNQCQQSPCIGCARDMSMESSSIDITGVSYIGTNHWTADAYRRQSIP